MLKVKYHCLYQRQHTLRQFWKSIEAAKVRGLSLRGSCRSRATIRIQIYADRKHPVSQWGKKQNQKNDVKILVYSAITGIPFITMDGASKSQPGGMLVNKAALKKLGIKILSPSDALAEIASTVLKKVN